MGTHDNTDLGDRMKAYEGLEAARRLLPGVPICARLDGRGFSRFTRDLRRPYDERLSALMVAVTRWLVVECQATAGYTQSDEMSLVFHDENEKAGLFDRRVQKLTSVLASMATAQFNMLLDDRIPEKRGELAYFDCRVWVVPSRDEAANTLLWREIDATKNSLSMATRHYYPHDQVQGKSGKIMHEMLHAVGVNWNDYPAFFKRGTFVTRRVVERQFTVDELALLPERHEARTNPALTVHRTVVEPVEMPSFRRVANRTAVLFDGAQPVTLGT